jgi:hypothetical protein
VNIFTRIETLGSVWFFDEDLKRYQRFPKGEKPREKPEWGNADAGVLQDGVWHDYERYDVDDLRLLIYYEGQPNPAYAPMISRTDALIRFILEGDI